MKKPSLTSRRKFLSQAPCAALSSISTLNLLAHLKFAQAAAADSAPPGAPPKSLVVLFLHGGQDSFNHLVPRDQRYSHYATARGALALPETSLLPLDQLPDGDGQQYGLHPSTPEMADLFNGTGDFAGERRLSFLANTGALAEPTTMAQFHGQSTELLLGLFSHIDQIIHWQTSVPQGLQQVTGWAGRAIDCIRQTASSSQVPLSLTGAGSNILQSGVANEPFVFRPDGSSLLPASLGSQDPSNFHNLRAQAFRDLASQSYANVMSEALATRTKDSLEAQAAFQQAYENHPLPASAAAFYKDQPPLATEFEAVTRSILARGDLGQNHQTFYLQAGGWDHHVDLLNTHAQMLQSVSQSLHAFQRSLKELAIEDQVLTLIVSEFGGTLRSNGRVSDHGWGGNVMAMGSAVRGGRVFGDYPSMELGNKLYGPQDVGLGGRFLPTLSTDVIVAEALRWFGLSDTSLLEVLPNLNRFWTPGLTPPIGYLR